MSNSKLGDFLVRMNSYDKCICDEADRIESEDKVDELFNEIGYQPVEVEQFDPDIPVLMNQKTGKLVSFVSSIDKWKEQAQRRKEREEQKRLEMEKEEEKRKQKEERHRKEEEKRRKKEEEKRRQEYEEYKQNVKASYPEWLENKYKTLKETFGDDFIIVPKCDFTKMNNPFSVKWILTHDDVRSVCYIDDSPLISFLLKETSDLWVIGYYFEGRFYEAAEVVIPLADEYHCIRFNVSGVSIHDYIPVYREMVAAIKGHNIDKDRFDIMKEFVDQTNRSILYELRDMCDPKDVKYFVVPIEHYDDYGHKTSSKYCEITLCPLCELYKYCQRHITYRYESHIYDVSIPNSWI